MFIYDHDYTYDDWRHEADARELAELDWDGRDMQETPPPVAVMESPDAKKYLAFGPEFADGAGAIGPEGLIVSQPKKHREAA